MRERKGVRMRMGVRSDLGKLRLVARKPPLDALRPVAGTRTSAKAVNMSKQEVRKGRGRKKGERESEKGGAAGLKTH